MAAAARAGENEKKLGLIVAVHVLEDCFGQLAIGLEGRRDVGTFQPLRRNGHFVSVRGIGRRDAKGCIPGGQRFVKGLRECGQRQGKEAKGFAYHEATH